MPSLSAERQDGLSIVVQGGLFRANRATIAANLARWRAVFPKAQLICAISSSDFLASGEDHPTPRLTAEPEPDDAAFLALLGRVCDVATIAPPCAVLPPIKTDSRGPNHVNLQIAAARAGLARSAGRHILRIRNDLMLDRQPMLAAHARAQLPPRGGRALFAERVLVSQLFTLNPLLAQRMPFHVSDWFHLGLASDLRRLWDAVVPLSATDAAWYAGRPHAAGSTTAERRFLTRWPPEQTITFPVFAAAFPDLSLTYHNDQTSVAASLSVVADNFGIANLSSCRAKLPQYQRDIDHMSSFTALECLSQSVLDRIAAEPRRPVADILRPETLAVARHTSRWARLRRATMRWSRRLFAISR